MASAGLLPSALLPSALLLSACAVGPSMAPVLPSSPAPTQAVAAPAGLAIPAAQQAGAVAALDAALKTRLGALPLSDAWRRQAGNAGQPSRLIVDADRAFEVGSAQLKPALLLPLAETAAVSLGNGAWVLQAIGRAPTAADADLAERRAASLIAYLGTQGIAGSRLRAETRRGQTRTVELHLVSIVVGREAEAWMPPADAAALAR